MNLYRIPSRSFYIYDFMGKSYWKLDKDMEDEFNNYCDSFQFFDHNKHEIQYFINCKLKPTYIGFLDINHELYWKMKFL